MEKDMNTNVDVKINVNIRSLVIRIVLLLLLLIVGSYLWWGPHQDLVRTKESLYSNIQSIDFIELK